ncbi:hypothetical protein FLW53_09765 [Microbispora sp. SCL1-1]|uniref:hypothetical protein n=1 Tax=unclassified Microbispora TaxID=2614687 RepID=UPI001159E1AD|nr:MULTISPECIES: hypothetical protein [unclassified Microbispora]NJP24491.1 hypothetical protein [Microbispora sp. CL1-1]TQS14637.1 hypothetical protein FLW53_09765 [Microbispora sp. SCL1-1]
MLSYLAPILVVLLLAVCSLHEVEDNARTPAEMVAAARRAGFLRTTAALGWGAVMVALLITTSILLAVTAHVGSLGGIR